MYPKDKLGAEFTTPDDQGVNKLSDGGWRVFLWRIFRLVRRQQGYPDHLKAYFIKMAIASLKRKSSPKNHF